MLYIGLHGVKRGDKYTEKIIYVLDYTSDYTSCQAMFWILRLWWICHAILLTIIWFYFHAIISLSLTETSLISSMETKQHWSVHVAPVHGALEEKRWPVHTAFAWTQIGRYGK